jgi:hypothetical protein
VAQHVVGARGLLHPVGIEFRQRLRLPDRLRHVPALVGVHAQPPLPADLGPQLDVQVADAPAGAGPVQQRLEELKKDRLPRLAVRGLDDVEDVYSCSPMQEGILLSQQRASGVYEIHLVSEIIATSLSMPVSIDRLQSAWQKVVDRHSSLRTVFIKSVSEEGLFDQVVLKKAKASR